ncbi:NUDIX domain-containing protein [Streptomyces phaeochromogenes]|uniref:NUDIX domain-containing protein n=1 Tax=Streptomyces phaeochromogenes TaxID=1923 RepID=UPI0033D55A9D
MGDSPKAQAEPGGKVNEAEPLVEAALRELSEESGCVGRGRRAVRGDSHPS